MSAGRPANCPTSARNSPGPSSTIGTTCPKPSRALTATVACDEHEHARARFAGHE
jgi:hypothetical protein